MNNSLERVMNIPTSTFEELETGHTVALFGQEAVVDRSFRFIEDVIRRGYKVLTGWDVPVTDAIAVVLDDHQLRLISTQKGHIPNKGVRYRD